jgi:hypothetical protein
MKTHVETTESNRNDSSGDHFLRSGNQDSHGVDPTMELMTSSTACLRARKVPADNPIAHGAGEPCKVNQDLIYIQVEVKPASYRQCGNEVACICATEDAKYWHRCITTKQRDQIRN